MLCGRAKFGGHSAVANMELVGPHCCCPPPGKLFCGQFLCFSSTGLQNCLGAPHVIGAISPTAYICSICSDQAFDKLYFAESLTIGNCQRFAKRTLAELRPPCQVIFSLARKICVALSIIKEFQLRKFIRLLWKNVYLQQRWSYLESAQLAP